ncbi:nucleotide sugar dehydrogenase [Bacillus sp. 1NLA3E]|uniref:nucleotide sugar dehydrogenase n=1 Tax=Bacillus sp. 1NLA3E TaxID=666686 RepID=UPI000247F089|nr:nucleotide sugar dehydrogenase [Bacillus sp. 1NLA3E]
MSKIAIIGLGYVGLPLAQLFLQNQHVVYGIDYDVKKVAAINNGKSYLSDFKDKDIEKMVQTGNFFVSNSYEAISNAEAIILCVPTPLSEDDTPDISYIENAISKSLPFLKNEQLVILESSTYPGTTEEIIVPLISQNKKFTIGNDFFVAYSPERIDPGQKQFGLHQIPKIVGGVTQKCTERAKSIYETIFKSVVTVSSPKVAEMSKLVENTQRLLNISLMNELAMFCDKMEINLWEVIEACSTKPFGFTPYFPGPGIGGHCIPVDPLYLLWKAEKHHSELASIKVAHEINQRMPQFVLEKIAKHIKKPLSTANLFVIGVTYKKDVNDIRESKALDILTSLMELGANVDYHDPFIPQLYVKNAELQSTPLSSEKLKAADCILILTDHSYIDYDMILEESNLIIDTRNAIKSKKHFGKVVLL